MIELLLDNANLNQAYERVKAKKGAGGHSRGGTAKRMGKQSPILNSTLTVARLKQRGYIAMAEYYHERRPS